MKMQSIKLTCKLVLLLLFILPFMPIVQSLTGYTLLLNETFENQVIGNFNTSGGTWTIQSTGGYTGKHLKVVTTTFQYAIINNDTYYLDQTKNYVIEGWLKDFTGDPGGSDGGILYNFQSSSDNQGSGWWSEGDNMFIANLSNGGYSLKSLIEPTGCGSFANTWRFFTLNVTNRVTHFTVFCDSSRSTLVSNYSMHYWDFDNGWFGFQSLRTMGFDDIAIYKESTPSPTLNLAWNLQNTINHNINHINITYNGTFTNENTQNCNCSFYVNDVLNQTFDTDISTLQRFNLTYGAVETTYNMSLNCSNYEVSNNLPVVSYKVDTIPPQLTITSSFVNGSVYPQLTPVTFSVNISDSNLFYVNVSWFNPSNTLLLRMNDTNLSQKGITSYVNTTSYTPSDIGSYSIIAEAYDSHTNNKVRPLQWDIQGNDLIANGDITFTGDLKALNRNGNLATYFYLSSTLDRYKVKLTFEAQALTHTINLSTTEDLVFLQESAYKGHFVYFKTKQWIDFESPNIQSLDITQVKSNHYTITMHLYNPSDEIELESIGDLNYINQVYTFNVTENIVSNATQINITNLNIEDDIEQLELGVWFFALVILYLGLMVIGYWMIITGNSIIGVSLWVLTIGFDLLFVAILYTKYIPLFNTTIYSLYAWVFYLGMFFWFIIKIMMVLLVKARWR